MLETRLGWDRIQFFRQMDVLCRAGMPLLRCLEICSRQTSNKRLKACIDEAYAEVRMGTRLSKALVQKSTVLSSVQVQALHAAELRGSLDQVFLELADWDEKDHKLQRRMVAALSYPLLVVAFAFFGLLLLVRFLLPLIVSVSQQLGHDPPPATRVLVVVGTMLQHPLVMLVLALGLATTVWGLKRARWSVRQRMRFNLAAMRLPMVGPLLLTAATIRICRSLAALLRSGLSLVHAVELTGQGSGSIYLQKTVFEPAADQIRMGDRLSQALRNDRMLPRSFHGMLAVGEQTGDMETVLLKVADLFEMELESRVDAFMSALEPIMICIVGVLVLILMVVGFMPLYEMLRGL